MNIGVLGGTFDPVHIGHLIIAEQARVELGLSEVLFVPAGQPWLKVNHNVTPAFHRVEMLRRAVASNPHFRVCTLEIDRAGPSYTVDTMAGLKDELGTESFFFILGQDSFDDLPLWKEPDRLVRMCQLAVVPRLGLRSPDLNSLTSSVRGAQGRVRTVSAPVVEVSSSEIRQRVAQGLSIRYLVPHEVEQYIAAQGLYQK